MLVGDIMELEVNSHGISNEAGFQAQEGNMQDEVASENVRCGICMDLIIDRGVLDCCSHWFCFACIDNWAAITNLCPLCKSEFQLITCIPVYDTIGGIKDEEYSVSRDDDWCIKGKNNTLSFPSYYIDEDAVVCLEGCKLRSGQTTTEEDLTLDTSIACDSCDIWYHAFCVGFDPGSASEGSWLCPRCKVDEVPPSKGPTKQHGLDGIDIGFLTDASLSGKVLVSVADTGDTAVVVSMVDINKEKISGTSLSSSSAVNAKPEVQLLDQIDCTELSNSALVSDRNEITDTFTHASQEKDKIPFHIEESGKPETFLSLSLSRDASIFSPAESLPLRDLKTKIVDQSEHKPSSSDGYEVLPSLSFEPSFVKDSQPSGSEYGIDLHLGLTMGSCFSVDMIVGDGNENKAVEVAHQKGLGPGDGERKCTVTARNDVYMDSFIQHHDGPTEINMQNEVSKKKIESEGASEPIPLKLQSEIAVKRCSKSPKVLKGNRLKPVIATSDIMSIVRGTDHRSSTASVCQSSAEKSTNEQDNPSGLRIKKIMRRGGDDNDSSVLVQMIRKEVREALSDKATKDSNKQEPFDAKLLTAFRAAIGRPNNKPDQRTNLSIVRAKKSVLQKGKTRESLTKKLYGTASGKRRRAWDRDWEIEFWKHRCVGTKPRKVETLQSVLELLKKSSDSCLEDSKVGGREGEPENPILSRLYLADASVFPRKEDVKPVSTLMGFAKNDSCENNKENNSKVILKEVPKLDRGNSMVRLPKEGNTKLVKESSRSDDARCDKRKWALEVLARKTAVMERDANRGKQEENSALKGNFPLLAQLPVDMRPILVPIRNNKVPMSVRQAQLNRIVEHYLRKADLPVIRRTAATELAVADAINVEKEICGRSNSKLVYMNICSQMLSQQTVGNKNPRTTETVPSDPMPVQDEDLEQKMEQTSSISGANPRTTETVPSDPMPVQDEDLEQKMEQTSSISGATNGGDVEEALRRAGLLSDSPPDSPYRVTKDNDDEDINTNSNRVRNDGFENIFDLDSHPDLDIYGDFEYDLEDDDYIGASNMARASKASNCQQDEGDSKIKVVLSTLNSEKPFILESEDDTLTLRHPNSENEASIVAMENCEIPGTAQTDNPCDSAEPPCIEDGDNTLAQCEELYGPDKECTEIMIFNEEPSKPNDDIEKEGMEQNAIPDERENSRVDMADENGSCAENNITRCGGPVNHDHSKVENSPTHSLTGENFPRKEPKSDNGKQSDPSFSILKKVEAYIKEHIRPLCKSGVISAEQYRWAVAKTADKVMKYHFKARNANFLIKEGHKVKKLADQYVQTAQQKKQRHSPLN